MPLEPDRHAPLWVFGLALLVRLGVWLVWDGGSLHPDEFFQSLEPAHFLAFGHGGLAWEWHAGIRSWVVPWFYAAPLRVIHALGLAEVGALVTVAQGINLLLSLLLVEAAWRLGRIGAGQTGAQLASICTVFFPVLLYYAPHTLGDTPAAIGTVLGLTLIVEIPTVNHPVRHAIFAGLWAGFAYVFRYTSPLFFVLPGIWLLWQRRWQPALILLGVFLGIVICMGLVDWITWGKPFHSIYEYLMFNVIRNGASVFGTAPAEWYMAQLYRDFGVLAFVTFAVIVRGAYGLGPIGASLLLGLTILSSQAHKEERFLFPIYTLIPPLLAIGAWHTLEGLQRLRVAASIILVILLIESHAYAFSNKDWAPDSDVHAALYFAARQPDMHGIAVQRDIWGTPGFVGLRINNSILLADGNLLSHDMNHSSSKINSDLINYIIAEYTDKHYLLKACGCKLYEQVRFGKWIVWKK